MLATNIVDNAIKFTKRVVRCAFRLPNKTALRVAVNNTGIGIKASEMQLFTKFHRGTSMNSTKGTGIGLYASKIIIEETGGR